MMIVLCFVYFLFNKKKEKKIEFKNKTKTDKEKLLKNKRKEWMKDGRMNGMSDVVQRVVNEIIWMSWR